MEISRIKIRVTSVIFLLLVLAATDLALASFPVELPSGTVIRSSRNVLTLKLKSDMSLYEMIMRSGYAIADEDVVSFLAEFAGLNEDMKSMSNFKKGSTVHIPLSHLKKDRNRVERPPQIREVQVLHEKMSSKRQKQLPVQLPEETESAREMLVRNIEVLTKEISRNAYIDRDNFKLFSMSERSEISLDTSYFPVVIMDSTRKILIDMHGVLPPEIKDLIEISWPEYRIISLGEQTELWPVITGLLDLMGFNSLARRKISAGGRTQIEYYSDILAYPRNGDILQNRILPIGIVTRGGYATPPVLLDWFRQKDVHIVELSYDERPKMHAGAAGVSLLQPSDDFTKFTEDMLDSMGYSFRRNETINLSDKKEFSFMLKTDLSLTMDGKRKIIEYADLSEYEMQFAKRKGFDIISVRSWDDRNEIVRRILALLSPRTVTESRDIANFVNPAGVKYRLISPGFFVHSSKGNFFIAESDLEPELLRAILDERIKLITF